MDSKDVEKEQSVLGNEGQEAPAVERSKAHVLEIGPGSFSVELPCGHIDKDGKLHRVMVVGEMTGYEEDILYGVGEIMSRLNQIISNCTKSIGSIVDRREISQAVHSLTAADRMCALIAIRRASLGDFYPVKVKCPNSKCGVESRFELDLANIKTKMMEDPRKRSREDTLTTGKVVEWHVINADDDEWLANKRKKKEDVMTFALLARVDKIDDEEVGALRGDMRTVHKALSVLKRLTTRERNEIRRLFAEHEGSVDTDVDFECPLCGYEWSATMDIGGPGFFFQ